MWVKWERWKECLDRGKATQEQVQRVKVNEKKRIRTRKKEKRGEWKEDGELLKKEKQGERIILGKNRERGAGGEEKTESVESEKGGGGMERGGGCKCNTRRGNKCKVENEKVKKKRIKEREKNSKSYANENKSIWVTSRNVY